MEILLLDKDGHDVPAGEVGEIIVKSRYLSPGYWRNELLTAERFVKDGASDGVPIFRSGDFGRRMPDGSLMFADREDARVKIHGHGVELSEIEAALMQRPEVENICVLHERHWMVKRKSLPASFRAQDTIAPQKRCATL